MNYSCVVERCIQYAQENWNQKICISDVAEIMNCSRSYIDKCFKDEIGITYFRYASDYKLEKGYELLQNGEKVTAVASMIGYDTPSGFYKAFSVKYNMTPQKVKENDHGEKNGFNE